ncbi:hypothetical protein PC114_g17077 [Phytophthora cactorum]|nr:hypothetical protein PC114_g17077 [Phytophthora cactorum]
MPSPSDSEDGKGKKQKGYKIGSSGTPVNRNGDDGTFYKHAMLNAFEMSLLDGIATSAETEDSTWDQEKKDKFKKKNPAMVAQKMYRLQGELHRTRLRTKGDVRSHLYTLFDIKDELEDLKAPVNNLQMVDLMLRSLPTVSLLQRTQEKGVI